MERYKYIFGPVPSRRLGLSLGIDLVPYKVCSYNCIYCECGKTTNLTTTRKSYINKEDALKEINLFLEKGIKIDYITFSGSGEPTLSSDIKFFIDKIKEICSVPICVLTNGSLFYNKNVRNDVLNADLIIPSLDAVSEEVFKKINRPYKDLEIKKIIEGLIELRNEYKNKYVLEILLVKGVNDSEEEIKKIVETAEKIRPDKVQLNTVVRPGTEKNLIALTDDELNKISKKFKIPVEIISKYKTKEKLEVNEDEIISIIRRRPMTIDDLINITGKTKLEIEKKIYLLKEREVKIKEIKKEDKIFYVIENEK